MSRGLGATQRAVLDIVEANPTGVAVDAIAAEVYGKCPTRAQLEATRRAVRSLRASGRVEVTTRWESRPRKSRRRFVEIAACVAEFCDLCAQRKRRVRLNDWHIKSMRANAKYDRAWLDDLALAQASGFVHATASAERVVEENPDAVDQCQLRLQFVAPVSATR